jgi:carbamoyltransferase
VIICGVKITHDGAVAVIEDGRLVFSVEMEKLGNADRHSRIEDMSEIFDILRTYGYRARDIDSFSIDGWRKTERLKPWYGHDVRVQLAPYRRGYITAEPLQQYQYMIADFQYVSFAHYTGHVVGGYCTSPFAVRGEDSYVLSWDGAMFPVLYFVEASTGKVHSLGPVFNFLGDAYHAISQKFSPFDAPLEFPATLSLPGKIMAYIARGSVRPDLMEVMQRCYDRVEQNLINKIPLLDDEVFNEPLGRQFLKTYAEELQPNGVIDADALTTWHAFLERLLIVSLESKLRKQQWPANNLIFVGGCALNIRWNRALRERGLVKKFWVPPFPNDAGAAIGAACCVWATRKGMLPIKWNVYSGPELKDSLPTAGWTSWPCSPRELAALLHETNEPVAFLNGRAELGPRALGNRSLLASPADPLMKSRLNNIKNREHYRPVAPLCLEHRAKEIFEPGDPDPYMLFEHDVRPDWKARIPAVCHEDGTARVQTVNREQNPVIFEVLTEFERLSGIPVLCNTSANRLGKGFFPDIESATAWGKVKYVWSNNLCYSSEGRPAFGD